MTIKVAEQEFVATWKRLGSPIKVSQALGLTIRHVYARRDRLAKRGIVLHTADFGQPNIAYPEAALKFERKRDFEIINGTVIFFTDPHFYPDHNEKPLKDLCGLIRDLKPKAVICGGDALDGTQISRYDPTRGFHMPPDLKEQVDCMKASLGEVQKAAGKGCILAMTLGNHDTRLSRYLAVNAPHWKDMPGSKLEDYIPAWPLSWTIRLNKSAVIRHRNQPGMLHLQAQKAGCHYIHGHTHNLNVHSTPQYYGFLYSVDGGSFADPNSDAFDYTEDAKPHIQGYVVMTYKDRKLMRPEIAEIDGKGVTEFRGSRL